jgi:CDP-glucose 4,6-dehydratase
LESLVVNQSFWRGKRVFLTGHTGFKGSWLSIWLQELGADVTGYALSPNTTPAMFDIADVGSGMKSIIGDIRDFDKLSTAITDAKPEIVLHLAAQPLVRLSYVQPRETYETNVMGTVNLLETIRQTKSVKAVVVVTSDKCYENRELGSTHTGYRENDPMGGFDPYSNSKGCAELVTSAYRQSYFHADSYTKHGVALASARAGNVIGGGDWCQDRLIPDFVRAMSVGKPLIIRNPHATRPWQHVLEPLSGYLLLAEQLFVRGADYASAWNFGPADADAKPVEWIAERLVSLWGQNASWQLDGGEHPHEATYLKLNSQKAHQQLSWRPRLNLAEALDWLAKWYQQYNQTNEMTMRAFSAEQIRRYQSK